MGLRDVIRARWKRFWKYPAGHYSVESELDADAEAIRAQIDFDKALGLMRSARVHFDKRPSSRPPPDHSPTSISGLNAKLELDDKAMKDAIHGIDEPEDQ